MRKRSKQIGYRTKHTNCHCRNIQWTLQHKLSEYSGDHYPSLIWRYVVCVAILVSICHCDQWCKQPDLSSTIEALNVPRVPDQRGRELPPLTAFRTPNKQNTQNRIVCCRYILASCPLSHDILSSHTHLRGGVLCTMLPLINSSGITNNKLGSNWCLRWF